VLSLAAAQRRGVGHSKADRAAMEAAVDALVAAAGGPGGGGRAGAGAATDGARLTAKWRLVWTSERETLFLLEKGFFGTSATEAYQTIDVEARALGNIVEFVNGTRFVVDSDITVQGEGEGGDGVRVNFAFTSARLELAAPVKATVPLPPVGKGWFDNVYVGGGVRVARDSRGDTLVVVRD